MEEMRVKAGLGEKRDDSQGGTLSPPTPTESGELDRVTAGC